jgi:TRAP transporter TAXI family solute receptor
MKKTIKTMGLTLGLITATAAGMASASEKSFISIGSCPVGCTAYTWSAGIAEVINKNVPGTEVAAEETKGYVQNVKLLLKGDLESAMSTTLSAYDAYHGEGTFTGAKPGQVLSWMSIAPVAQHIITLADSEINTLADLKGKKVGLGQPGGTSMLDADALVKDLGLAPDEDFKPFRVRLGNMLDMMSDGNLDAAIWFGTFPLPPLIKLDAQHDIKLLEIPEATVSSLRKSFPPYFPISIPANTYKDITEDTKTYGLGNALVLHADVSDETAYQMTKAIFDNLDYLKTVHPAFAKVTKETVLSGFAAPLHPGVLKYYREIGVPGIEEFVKRTSH